MTNQILFFADRLPPLIGGVETHAKYFIEYFRHHPKFPLVDIVTKNGDGEDYLLSSTAVSRLNPTIIFFNSGRWIEELSSIRKAYPKAIFIYRTGGNEIIKAPLSHARIPNHKERQSYWAKTLNHSIDVLITNSAYTEGRLRDIGITCPFERCVGGVNVLAIKEALSEAPKQDAKKPITLFCSARFVSYKNHSLLISVVQELIKRGHQLRVRLAGDGPLLDQAKEQVHQGKLDSVIEFIGVLDNRQICREIAHAKLYIQLSTDQLTNVPGGSYIHSEGMGRSILEALTAGIFVIAGNSGALSEIICPERGILLALDNIPNSLNKIDSILQAIPNRKPFRDDFSWANIFEKYEHIFERVLD